MSEDSAESTGAAPLDVVVVGAGPAGLTAAIYTGRSRLSTVILERGMAGGQIALTERIENYPGFPEGIPGFDLAEQMKAQALAFGAELREIEAVTALEATPTGTWRLVTDRGSLEARVVILAPGVEPRRSGVPGEAEFVGRGVSWCATCDGALYRGRTVAVIGGGDAAVEEALYLTKFAEKVFIVHRRDQLRATPIVQERAFANPKIEFVWSSVPTRIKGDQLVEQLEVQHVATGELRALPVNGVFIYIGQDPNTAWLRGSVALDERGFLLTDELLQTDAPGVFACGDARANALKQVATAVGEGAIAAQQALHYLDAAGGSTAAPASAPPKLPQEG